MKQNNLFVAVIFFTILANITIIPNSSNYIPVIDTNSSEYVNTQDVKILVLMDNDFGQNYQGIFDKFQRFGWNITIAGPTKKITGCDFTGNVEFEVDILFSEIENISQYHCINIMPGETHVNLLANKDGILNIIKTANSNNIKISAWCKAVLVLAVADVIDGKDVTGDAIYQEEYEEAGATFFELVPPIIDGNIITGVRSNFYQTEICIAIATAIGCYEENVPIIEDPILTYFSNGSVYFSINIIDESGVYLAKLAFDLISTHKNTSPPTQMEIFLKNDNNLGNFSTLISEEFFAIYNVTIFIEDVFWNSISYNNITEVTLNSKNLSLGTMAAFFGLISLSTFLMLKKRKFPY